MDERHEIVEDRESAAGMEAAEEGGDEKLVIALKKPYLFEGKEYTEIDLTGMDDMTAADMIALENQYDKRHPGINVMPEVRVEYAVMMAARAAIFLRRTSSG